MPTDNTIKIKRSTGTTAPVAGTSIAIGELATTMDSTNNGASNKVYLGIQNSSAGTSAVVVGGKYYTDAVDNLAYFKTVSVSGQSDVVAETAIAGDTLNLAAGTGISITTNASTDTVTISSTLGGGTVTSITPAGDTGTGTAITSSGTITVAGTANEIETSVSGTTITVGLPNNVTVGNNLIVTGNLTVNGTTTTVNSTTTTVDDPIFTIGGDTAPSSDDNKDRGIEFRWHNGTASKIGFFGWDDSASAFAIWGSATNTSEVFATAETGGRANLYMGNTIRLFSSASDSNYCTLTVSPTGTNSVTIPDVAGTIITTGNLSSITSTGTITSGTWNGTAISPAYGGTGVANNAASTLTISGNFGTTFTVSNTTSVTLPTSGTLATLAGTETLTNKTINLTSNTLSGTTAQFNSALSDGDFATLAGTETLTNKTINLTSNTLSGTTAQFNSALSDGDFATLAGTETLTNKTLTSANLTTPAVGGTGMTFAGSTSGTVSVLSTAAAGGILTLPNATGTFITTGNLSSITTVGTITSGTWTGSVIGPAYGGTGIANNAANTITFSGNYGLTLTLSNTTSVTLPTTGTLATLAGTETLTNKTIDGGTF